MNKLLLDENITPHAALILQQEGHDIVHVRERGLVRRPDHEVFALAQEDRIVVTMNVRDFRALARSMEIHVGVVLVAGGNVLRRDDQIARIRQVLAFLAQHPDLVNRALVFDERGGMALEDVARPEG